MKERLVEGSDVVSFYLQGSDWTLLGQRRMLIVDISRCNGVKPSRDVIVRGRTGVVWAAYHCLGF